MLLEINSVYLNVSSSSDVYTLMDVVDHNMPNNYDVFFPIECCSN